jgi:hypothetical protein
LKKSCIIGFAAFYGIWNLELFISLLSDSGENRWGGCGEGDMVVAGILAGGDEYCGWVSKASWYVLAFLLISRACSV